MGIVALFAIFDGGGVYFVNYIPCRRSIRSYFRFDVRKWRFSKAFWRFRSVYFEKTRRYIGPGAIIKEDFDQYWVGSDQVWNPIYCIRHDGSVDGTYFLDFAPSNKRKVAYAASIGEGQWGTAAADVAAMIRSFDAVSLRENYARENICKLSGVDACVVPDPVFLLRREEYEELARKPVVAGHGRHIFVYGIGEARECVRQVGDVLAADSKSFATATILNFTFKVRNAPRIKLVYPTPQEWLGEILSADFVITDSFHCSAMCLILHRPFRFVSKPLESKTNDRLFTMFAKLGVTDTENPDWQEVDRRIEAYRNMGENYIKRSLGAVVGD